MTTYMIITLTPGALVCLEVLSCMVLCTAMCLGILGIPCTGAQFQLTREFLSGASPMWYIIAGNTFVSDTLERCLSLLTFHSVSSKPWWLWWHRLRVSQPVQHEHLATPTQLSVVTQSMCTYRRHPAHDGIFHCGLLPAVGWSMAGAPAPLTQSSLC